MMDLSFIKSLIKAVDQSSIDSVDIERGGTRVRISKTPPAAAPAAAPAPVHHVQVPGAAAPQPNTVPDSAPRNFGKIAASTLRRRLACDIARG